MLEHLTKVSDVLGFKQEGDAEVESEVLKVAKQWMADLSIVQNCLRPLKEDETREDLATIAATARFFTRKA